MAELPTDHDFEKNSPQRPSGDTSVERTPDVEKGKGIVLLEGPSGDGDDDDDDNVGNTKKGITMERKGTPARSEVWVWYLYELCSYFIHSTVLPVLFPLIISQILDLPREPAGGWGISHKGLYCNPKEMKIYEALAQKSITMGDAKFSPLEWTSFSWSIGLILVAPMLGYISTHLDHGRKQLIIAGAAIATGVFFCLPVGFFNVTWIFPPYIAAIVAASTIAAASHTRDLGLMVRGFTGPALQISQFPLRREVSSWLSLYATAAGCLGSVVISTFIYYMLHYGEKFLSLWVVSIFSGLKWAVGISHIFFIKPGPAAPSSVSPTAHFFSIFRFPHAFGTLIVTFLSSFTTMCIFASAVLYLIGYLCFKRTFLLYFWLIYFTFPIISLPLMQPLQHLLRANTVKMHLLGLLLSLLTSGIGFYFRDKLWGRKQVMAFAAIQSTSVGLLHAFGRVLLMECSPHGKEGAFSAWFSWSRAAGTLAGFAVATAIPGKLSTAFGVAFCVAMAGVLMLIYGNISDFKGAMAAGNVSNEDGGDAEGWDASISKDHDHHKAIP